QAVYAVRGLLWLSRMGVDRAHWYFYANVDLESTDSQRNYDRSGLTESLNFNFKEKRSFFAAEALQNRMASLRFQEVLKEDEKAHIYLLRNEDGEDSHLIAWRPVTGDDSVAVNLPFPYELSAASAWYLSGLDPQGENATVRYENGQLLLPLSSKPLLIQLGKSSPSSLRMQQEASLRAEETDGKVKLILKTGSPLHGSESIALTQDLKLGNISWEKSDELTWHSFPEQLRPGSYQTSAILKGTDGQLQTSNAVHFVIKSQVTLNPNPSTGLAAIEVKRPFTEPSQLTLLSVDGQVVGTYVLPANETVFPLPVAHLKTGLYIIKLENSSFTDRIRFLKE
ncbi:MAG: T9SS type A sorting domain-containing protein, partial [Cyclobacterium sp.]|uniref:T9SS type A sorting domain-containing protein n=1 Tax=Cyclobacterium sp. TaxID=1966343 RepID=UPI0039704F9B